MTIYTYGSDCPDKLTLRPDRMQHLGEVAARYDSIQWTHKGLTFELDKTMVETAVEIDVMMRQWPAFKAQRKPVVFPASSCREVK